MGNRDTHGELPRDVYEAILAGGAKRRRTLRVVFRRAMPFLLLSAAAFGAGAVTGRSTSDWSMEEALQYAMDHTNPEWVRTSGIVTAQRWIERAVTAIGAASESQEFAGQALTASYRVAKQATEVLVAAKARPGMLPADLARLERHLMELERLLRDR